MKILIVDDNARMRQLIGECIQASAREIIEGSDGDEAYALYEQHKPDWVLMDQQMLRTDGITATREIIAAYPEANICMVTAYDDDDLRKAAMDAGASGFVVKDNLGEIEVIFASDLEH